MRNLLIIALAGLIKHGSALVLNPFPANVQQGLREHYGIADPATKLSVTLVWYGVGGMQDCDLDLHVFEPNGHEIYYGNRGPLPTTGRYYVDSSVVGSGGTAVEHIAWVSVYRGQYRVAVKNYGKCSQGRYYRLYVQRQGVTDMFERSAPAHDDNLYQVLSFYLDHVNTNLVFSDVTNIIRVAHPRKLGSMDGMGTSGYSASTGYTSTTGATSTVRSKILVRLRNLVILEFLE